MGTISMSPGCRRGIFVQVAPLLHVLDVENLRRKPLVVDPPEQQHLRVLGVLGKAAGNGDRFGQCNGAAHLVLSGMGHLAVGDEVGLLEVFQNDRDHGIVEDLAVGGAQSLGQLGNGLARHFHVSDGFQRDISVRLHGHRLVELRAELEVDVERLSLAARR